MSSEEDSKPKKHLDFSINDIKEYLRVVKKHIKDGNYSLSKNRNKNIEFIENYKINTEKEKEILLSLDYEDFCYAVDNYKGEYSNETLYVFCKQKSLDYWGETKEVYIYIKINLTKISTGEFVFIISFHEKEAQIKYLFKEEGYF